MPTFLTDSLTDATNTLLESHTGETGATWTKHPNFASGSIAIDDANRIRGNSTNTNIYYSSGTPAGADYDIDWDITPIGGTLSMGVMGRMSTTATTYYLMDYENAGTFNLYALVNGSSTKLGSSTQSLSNGTTYHCRLSMRGGSINCYVNLSGTWTNIISVTDTTVTAAGRVGIYFGTNDTNGSSGLRIDNLLAATPNVVGVTDPNVFFSPYNWYSDGAGSMAANNIKGSSTYALSNTPGAYFKTTITAGNNGTATLLLDTTPLNGITAGNCPKISISLDGAAFTATLLAYATGTTRLTISNLLSSGTHTIAGYFTTVDQTSQSSMGDRWNTPASCIKITGLELDGYGSATASQTVNPKSLLVFGDSITEGCDAVGSNNVNGAQDATQTYGMLLGDALNAEVGIVAFSYQGWTCVGSGNTPAFTSSFEHYYNGASRLVSGKLSPVPDYILVMHGNNDVRTSASDASVTSAVTSWLGSARADSLTSQIFVTIPFNGSKRSAITSGFNNTSPDAGMHLIDLGAAIQPTISSGGLNTNDGTHPNVRGHATFSALLVNQLRPILGAGSFVGADGEFVGGSIQLSTGAFST